MCALHESEHKKGTPLRKPTNKDTYRCLMTIWSIEVARRVLNEPIFAKTSNSTCFSCFAFTLIFPAPITNEGPFELVCVEKQ